MTTVCINSIDDYVVAVQRRTSLSIDHTRLQEIHPARPARHCRHYLVPLGLFSKDLLLDFDVRDESGNAVAALSRLDEAKLAQAMVLQQVRVMYGVSPAPERLRSIVLDYVSAVDPEPDDSIGDVLLTWQSTQEANGGISVAERGWVSRALQSPTFVRWAEVLRHNHILVVAADCEADRVLKVMRVESLPIGKSVGVSKPAVNLELDVPDFGWPRSDHLRVEAPPETVFTDSMLVPSPGDTVEYVLAGHPQRVAFYRYSSSTPHGQSVSANVRLWPTPAGQTFPVFLMAMLVPILLLSTAAVELLSQLLSCTVFAKGNPECSSYAPLWGLSDAGGLDAAVGLGFLPFTLLLVYVLREGEPTIRNYLLHDWRVTAAGMLAFPWFATVMLLGPRDLFATYFFGAIWALTGAIAIIPSWRVARTYREIDEVKNLLYTSGPRDMRVSHLDDPEA